MSEEQKQEVAEHARKASRQAKNAAKNGLKAVQHGTEAAAHIAAEELKDEARKAEGTVEDAVRSVKGSDMRLAAAVTAIFLGGTYLVGRIAGARQARRMTTPTDVKDIMDVIVKSDTPIGPDA